MLEAVRTLFSCDTGSSDIEEVMTEMPDAASPDCFGFILPDLLQLEYNKPCKGKAFTVLVTSLGIGVKSRQVDFDQPAWDNCRRCPSYASCYDVSMAKFVLTRALW